MKLGVIGVGNWGKRVATEYIRLRDEGILESVILFDKDKTKIRPFKRTARVVESFRKFLELADATHVCTPNQTHYRVAKRCLESGIHVLLEKPITMNRDEAYELVKLSLERDLILQVGHIYRFANVIRKVKELYESKKLGKVYYFTFMWTHMLKPMKGVSVLWDLLPHPIDIINFVTKKWPRNFHGISLPFRRKRLSETCFLSAFVDTKVSAFFYLSWLTCERRRILEIASSKTTIVADCVEQTIRMCRKGGKWKEVKVEKNNTIRDQGLNFIKAVESGKNLYNPSIVGVKSVEIIEEAVSRVEKMER